MLLDSMLARLPSFQDFLQSIFHAMLCAVAIAERSMGDMVHVCTLAWYKSMVLRVERQTYTNVVWSLQMQWNALTMFESREALCFLY
jgi:hypothetical protein